ncbi:tripartite tricarboxylate transporter substrate binding protein [Zeimonas arvi]|uniref:Tripartite tricarboxylate transporter substrate binding protein n=1 Tax=Zeimonas arvi TaxID=2498847 RepID=A0A5C8NU68_9BURK|nr:tripartite tricarboxylate transporter substrate binding protein [Zeimonas arvi]TXL64705.1 tripartite tricarboxylate transporter substrate binding protein [Zeimonas arvi]
MQRREFLAGAGALAAAGAMPALAQSFPTRPVVLYCAFSAGGPTDQVFRVFAEAATRTLGGSVVVENKPGAGGTLAALSLRSARPDGHTLAQAPMGLFRIPHMQKNRTFDPIADFTYISCLTGYTFGLVVPADSPIKSIKDLIEYAKANPGKFTYGSPGANTSPHLAMEEFSERAGIKLNHVPFKGNADAMVALLGGHIMSVSDSTGWAPHLEAGKVRLLATYGSKRTKRWPDIPTLTELGYDTVSDSPFGLIGPKGMDPAVVKKLDDAFKAALDEPKVKEIVDRFDQPVVYMNSADYTAWAKRTYEAEKKTIERLGLVGTI